MRLKIIILFIATCLLVPYDYAQVQIEAPLKEAIWDAIDKSFEVQNKSLEMKKIEEERKSVWNKYVPKVNASASYLYTHSDVTIDFPTGVIPLFNIPIFEGKAHSESYGNIFHAGINAKTVLFSGFQIENGAKALEEKKKATAYLTEAEKEKLVTEVIQSFDQLHVLNAVDKLLEESKNRLDVENNRVERAIKEGLTIPYDREKIKLASLELESKQIEMEGKRNLLYQKIYYLTGYNKEEVEQVIYQLQPYTLNEDLTIENKQELKALESFKNATDYLIKKEKGSYLPVLGAFGSLNYASLFNAGVKTNEIAGRNIPLHAKINEFTLGPNWMLGVSMQWEIFGGFERKNKVKMAEIQSRQIENQLNDTKEKLELLLANNLTNYKIQNKVYQNNIEKEHIAEKNLFMATRQYQEGLISISERLEAENDFFKASTEKIESLMQQRKTALETLSATGDLMQIISK